MRTASSLPLDVQCIFVVRCGRLRATLRSLFPTVFLFSSVSQVTNKCKNNRYILQQVTWVQCDSILKWSSKVPNLFKLLKLNRKKSKAEIFRNFRNVNKKPKEISATFAESSDAFVSFLSFYFSFSCWSGSSRVRSFFFM